MAQGQGGASARARGLNVSLTTPSDPEPGVAGAGEGQGGADEHGAQGRRAVQHRVGHPPGRQDEQQRRAHPPVSPTPVARPLLRRRYGLTGTLSVASGDLLRAARGARTLTEAAR